jgi:hypothetical protein
MCGLLLLTFFLEIFAHGSSFRLECLFPFIEIRTRVFLERFSHDFTIVLAGGNISREDCMPGVAWGKGKGKIVCPKSKYMEGVGVNCMYKKEGIIWREDESTSNLKSLVKLFSGFLLANLCIPHERYGFRLKQNLLMGNSAKEYLHCYQFFPFF